MKLQAKLLLVIVPLIVLPLLTLGWIGYSKLRDTSTEGTLKEMTTLLDQLGHNVQATLQTAQANLELFSRSALLQRYVLTADESARYNLLQPTLLSLFRSYQEAYPNYYEIRVLLPDGYEDTRATQGTIANLTDEEGDTPYFREIQQSQEDSYSNFFHNPDNHQIALLVAKKLRLRDPSVDPLTAAPVLRGYLIITVDLSFMGQQVKENRVGSSGAIFFTDGAGTVLFHPNPSEVGLQLAPALFAALRYSVAQKSILTTQFEGKTFLFEGKQLHRNLFLFASLPQQELLAASLDLGQFVAGITVVTILVAVTLLIVFLKYFLVNRIKALGNAALEIGRGNLLVPITGEEQDEIGRLARSFREMANNLAQSNEQIRQLAFYDSLTGLPNRLMFRDHLDYAIAHAARTGKPLALLFLDFDNFKWINDTLGHEIGDEFLKEMAQRIANALRREDSVVRMPVNPSEENMVARLGGDEFLILLQDLNVSYDAGKVAGRILGSLAYPIILAEHEFRVTGSIGITLYPEDGSDVDILIKNADIAMYEAKQRGKNNYQYYSDSIKDAALRRLEMETKLRRALENDELMLYYQPRLETSSGRVVGFEALLRWQDPELGMIPPSSFIPLAEETGLIIPITAWVLKEAGWQNKAWQDMGLKGLSISVNISGIDVNRTNISAVVAKTLEETGLDTNLLIVELTETCVMSAQEKAVQTLEEIKALGVKISLDDFGTGYSSLNYLRRFPIDELKIDRSFLANLPASQDDAAIVATIIAIACNLGLTVTAEGVETEEQLEFLRTAGCDFVQGFLFSPAVPAQLVPQLINDIEKMSSYISPVKPPTPAGRNPSSNAAAHPSTSYARRPCPQGASLCVPPGELALPHAETWPPGLTHEIAGQLIKT